MALLLALLLAFLLAAFCLLLYHSVLYHSVQLLLGSLSLGFSCALVQAVVKCSVEYQHIEHSSELCNTSL